MPVRRATRLTPNQIEVPCAVCGTLLYSYPSQRATRPFCDRLCLGKWRSAQADANAAHWQGGEQADKDGRVSWHLPWHPRADRKGNVPRAFIVVQLATGRMVQPGEIVHHRDEHPANDDPANLEVSPNQAEHARHHGTIRGTAHMRRGMQ